MSTVIGFVFGKDSVKDEIKSSIITLRQRNNNILHLEFKYPKEEDRKLLFKIWHRYSYYLFNEDHMDLFATAFRYGNNEYLRKILAEDMEIDLDKHTYTLTREIQRMAYDDEDDDDEGKKEYEEAVILFCPVYTLLKYNKKTFKLPTELLRMLKDFLYY